MVVTTTANNSIDKQSPKPKPVSFSFEKQITEEWDLLSPIPAITTTNIDIQTVNNSENFLENTTTTIRIV